MTMTEGVMPSEDIEEILNRRLSDLDNEIEQMEIQIEPLREEARKIRAMLREYSSGSLTSKGLTDEQIVSCVAKIASVENPQKAPEIAAALGVDGRGISKRLPRMARDGLLSGSSEAGYWVDAPVRRRGRG